MDDTKLRGIEIDMFKSVDHDAIMKRHILEHLNDFLGRRGSPLGATIQTCSRWLEPKGACPDGD